MLAVRAHLAAFTDTEFLSKVVHEALLVSPNRQLKPRDSHCCSVLAVCAYPAAFTDTEIL